MVNPKDYRDADSLASHVVDSLWSVFSHVRNFHHSLKVSSPVILWAFPGEDTNRPSSPLSTLVQQSTHPTSTDSISLLPSLSGLLRCIALELKRPILLISTKADSTSGQITDLISYLYNTHLLLGDFHLVNHILYSYEPRLLKETSYDISSRPLTGNILSLGGARGIVSEILTRLADPRSSLSVVGRTPIDPLDPSLIGLSKQDLMRTLIDKYRKTASTEPVTPKSLQSEVDNIRRREKLGHHLSVLSKSVSTFNYQSLDLSSAIGVDTLFGQESFVNASVLVSGAGVIQDQSCLTKSRESFEAVLRTKVVPACTLLTNGIPSSLRTWIIFSSIASKSGNPGQSDYAAANEFLNTVAHWFSRRHPQINIRTINWGPWKGTGMASPDVLSAFHERGLAPITADAGANFLRLTLESDQSIVETSAVSLINDLPNRLHLYQSLISSSPIWKYHSLPPTDVLSSSVLPIFFHPSVPYLQGHRKKGTPVVPAVAALSLAADFAFIHHPHAQQGISLNLYVYNGITLTDNLSTVVNAHTSYDTVSDIGSLTLTNSTHSRPYYKVGWSFVDPTSSDHQYSFTPGSSIGNLLFCDLNDIYSKCLFHSGVMASISSRITIDPATRTSWCSARSTCINHVFGTESLKHSNLLANYDLTVLDALLQLLLVQTIETIGVSALPQELSMTLIREIPPDTEVNLTATIVSVNNTQIEARGACQDLFGNLLFTMDLSKFTASKELLDFPPGISYSS